MNKVEYIMPTMLTIRQTAERTGLSRYYLRQACERNEITHIKSGRMVLINYERLIDHLNGRD